MIARGGVTHTALRISQTRGPPVERNSVHFPLPFTLQPVKPPNVSLAWTATWRVSSRSDERDHPEFAINNQRFSVARPLALWHHVQQRFRTAATRGTDTKKETTPNAGHSDAFPSFISSEGHSNRGLFPHYSKTTVSASPFEYTFSPHHFSSGVNLIIIGGLYRKQWTHQLTMGRCQDLTSAVFGGHPRCGTADIETQNRTTTPPQYYVNIHKASVLRAGVFTLSS